MCIIYTVWLGRQHSEAFGHLLDNYMR